MRATWSRPGEWCTESVTPCDPFCGVDAARADVLAFTAFPKELWRQIWSNNSVLSDLRELLADSVEHAVELGVHRGGVELVVGRRAAAA